MVDTSKHRLFDVVWIVLSGYLFLFPSRVQPHLLSHLITYHSHVANHDQVLWACSDMFFDRLTGVKVSRVAWSSSQIFHWFQWIANVHTPERCIPGTNPQPQQGFWEVLATSRLLLLLLVSSPLAELMFLQSTVFSVHSSIPAFFLVVVVPIMSWLISIFCWVYIHFCCLYWYLSLTHPKRQSLLSIFMDSPTQSLTKFTTFHTGIFSTGEKEWFKVQWTQVPSSLAGIFATLGNLVPVPLWCSNPINLLISRSNWPKLGRWSSQQSCPFWSWHFHPGPNDADFDPQAHVYKWLMRACHYLCLGGAEGPRLWCHLLPHGMPYSHYASMLCSWLILYP